MATFEDQLLQDAEDDRLAVEYIRGHLPQEIKEKFTDDDLYYFLDVLGEYYVSLIDKAGDDEEVDIDVEATALHLAKQAKKDEMGEFDPEDIRWVVDAELDYGESLET